MANNPLKIAPPPPRPSARPPETSDPERKPEPEAKPKAATPKFDQVKESERVQFNKRVERRVADGFEMLAIKSRRKVPDLLAEALELLEKHYGKV